ncbi:BspA family leucine-rich repeat surface protein [Mycoplasma capricolum]|uniref:BspA family leucine-rich repeat surface protein n=1 Tax=Mycoplasma capricolum TaxID=2095 RepID=UPI000317617F|nr:BspA family leucine-rich repeat surface protein [Mycoplasma capricolum]
MKRKIKIQKAKYIENNTICIEIGYFENENEECQIEQFKPRTKKVPNTLPSCIENLSNAFKWKKSEKIKGIEDWDVSEVTDMSYMFFQTSNFNQDISNWNTSNVENMSCMFKGSKSFNQNINTKIVDILHETYHVLKIWVTCLKIALTSIHL